MANDAIAIPEKLTADQLREFNARKIKKPKQDNAAKVLIRKRKRASAKSKSASQDNVVTIKSLKPLEPLYETPTERAAGFQQSKGSRSTGSRRDVVRNLSQRHSGRPAAQFSRAEERAKMEKKKKSLARKAEKKAQKVKNDERLRDSDED